MTDSRTKGAVWERQVAALIRDLGYDARRGLSQSRSGMECPDVIVVNVALWIECKAGRPARYPLAALHQAEDASGGIPCVAICRVDRGPQTATMRFGTLRDCKGTPLDAEVITMDLDAWLRWLVVMHPPAGVEP